MNSIEQLKTDVEHLQAAMNKIERNTEDLLEAWNDAKGALKALAWIGSVARWVTAVAGSIGLIYIWMKK